MSVPLVGVLRGTATEVGLVNAAGWVPYRLFGLFVGAAVDRVQRRPVLIVAARCVPGPDCASRGRSSAARDG